MFSNLFRRRGDGTETCPRCFAPITKFHYVDVVQGVPFHVCCGAQQRIKYEDVTKRNAYGFPIKGDTS